ncbi:MAG: alpha/beta hydrolase [Gammaproteobacteria bacterium]|jgi:pimeloyl-ACP methyl ester carboxylesterase|nr:alpha/beta hydrolase [Gammaproteobacteria bacterium]
MAIRHTIEGAEGVALAVREFGNPAGIPLVLIHGWTQSHLCWVKQYESALADEFRIIAPDLRGHGDSAKPVGEAHYTNSRHWADDLAAVINTLGLEQPVLAGWSYGGLVSGLYLRHYGEAALGGINFVGAGVRVAVEHIGTLLGALFAEVVPKVSSDDLGANIEGIRLFLRACFTAPISRDDWETVLAFNIAVPPHVRAGLLAAPGDITPELAKLTKPVLMSHGLADEITLPAMGQLLLDHCPVAKASWYEGVGHGPFLESPERFNTELAEFARSTRA